MRRAGFLSAATVLLISATSFAGEKPRSDRCQFKDVTKAAGITFKHTWGSPKMRNIIDSVGSGAGFFDYNDDGLLDLYLLQGAGKPSTLYRNNGDGTFTDVTKAAGVENLSIGLGIGASDYDNDGHTDLLVTNYGGVKLYHNEGNGTFREVTEKAGLAGGLPFVAHAAWSDIDKDGYLDLLLIRYVDYRPDKKVHAGALSKREGFTFFAGPLDYDAVEQSLFRNLGNGAFRDITIEAGLTKKAKGCAVGFGDLNDDGSPDFVIANDRWPKYLYENDGKGHFKERGMESGIALDEKGEATGGMAVAIEDFDGDAKPEVIITTSIFEHNPLFRDEGKLKYKDVAEQAGLTKNAYRFVAFGIAPIDIDNDGWKDIVITNGHMVDYVDAYSTSITSKQERSVYWNKGKGKFDLITPECGDINVKKLGRGLAYGDYDNDGRMDLIANDAGDVASLYHNETKNPNHWLRVKVIGKKSNRDGIGSKLYATAGGRTQYQEVRSESGYMATNDSRPLFGLGTAKKVDRLEIKWPSGTVDVLEGLDVDRTVTVTEGETLKTPAKK